MNKLLLLLSACILTLSSFATSANAAATAENDYFINDQQVEQLISNSVDISTLDATQAMLSSQGITTATNQAFFYASDKNFVAAILLNFFLGGLGIHRLYLGTKTFTWIGYILTCGGIFGVVPLVDFIVLIINNQDISNYVDNPKFFMWGGGNM